MGTKQQVKKKATGITVLFLIEVALFMALLFLFYFVADEIVLERNNTFDTYIFGKLSSITSPATTNLMLIITWFGSNAFLLPAYIFIVLYYFVIRKNARLAFKTAIIGLTSVGILFLMKDIFRRPRPLDPLIAKVSGFSFPSGHSFSAFTFSGLMIYLIWETKIQRTWKWLLSIFFFLSATFIAITRVYLHVHYASDVLGGFCVSIMWLVISLLLLHRLDRMWPQRV